MLGAMKMVARSDGRFSADGAEYRCALGKGGVVAYGDKREGDGASPIGVYRLRWGLYRSDRIEPPATTLQLHAIKPDDGWCDAPEDPAYNRFVRLPYPASCETLTRKDELYDILVVLDHNDGPPISGAGSAIFLHCAKPGYPPTRGCVAMARPDLESVLKTCTNASTLEIRR